MHRVTGKCELQRILDKAQPGARTSNHLEHCLRRSRNAKIRALVNEDVDIANSVVMLLHAKSIPNEMCAEITLRLGQIIGYTRIVSKVEMVRQRKHNVDISEYEHHLRQIWSILQPNMTLTGMKSKQWAEIGFQGEEPHTDLRGMGMLGLVQLWYFVTIYPDVARHVYSHSIHPVSGYPFAIVGISLTSTLRDLLQSGRLRYHFYNVCLAAPKLEHFHEAYCYLFYQFDKFWCADKPKDIMEFGRVSKEFKAMSESQLRKLEFVMKMEFQKDIP